MIKEGGGRGKGKRRGKMARRINKPCPLFFEHECVTPTPIALLCFAHTLSIVRFAINKLVPALRLAKGPIALMHVVVPIAYRDLYAGHEIPPALQYGETLGATCPVITRLVCGAF